MPEPTGAPPRAASVRISLTKVRPESSIHTEEEGSAEPRSRIASVAEPPEHGRHHFASEGMSRIESDDPFLYIFEAIDTVQELALPLVFGANIMNSPLMATHPKLTTGPSHTTVLTPPPI